MFNLNDQIGEPYPKSAKLCFLFGKVQNAELKHPLEAVQTVVRMNPDALTFTSPANHLSSLVKPRSKRELAAVTTQDNSDGDKSEILKNGKIYTNYYPNWRHISRANQKLAIAERKKLGKFGKNSGKSKKGQKDWKRTVKGLKKFIAALKKKVPSVELLGDESEATEPTSNARNSFGGRAEKVTKRHRQN